MQVKINIMSEMLNILLFLLIEILKKAPFPVVLCMANFLFFVVGLNGSLRDVFPKYVLERSPLSSSHPVSLELCFILLALVNHCSCRLFMC